MRGFLACLALGVGFAAAETPLPENPQRPREAAGRGDRIAYLPVSDQRLFMVDAGLTQFLRRRVEEAEREGVSALVLELDTNGGTVADAMEISALLMGTSIPKTVAYVRTKAFSAGTMIALACQEVVMREGAQLGDCAPILMTPEGMQEGPEKIKTVIRAQFRNYAERHGYPSAIMEGMVDTDLEVYEVEIDGRTEYVTDVTLAELEARGGPIAKKIPLKRKGQLFTFTAREAKRFGIARAIVESDAELFALYGWNPEQVVRIDPTWSETLVRFLSMPVVSSLLMLIGLMGIYMEFKAPGTFIPGGIALVCFALLFGGNYLAGLAEAWEMLVFALGLGLILVEIFVVPGFGVIGIAGIGLVLFSLTASLLPPADWGSEPWKEIPFKAQLWTAGWTVMSALVGSLLGFAVVATFFHKMPGARRIMHTGQIVETAPSQAAGPDPGRWAGRDGVTLTALRPNGKIRLGNEVLEASSDGGYLDPGVPVEVVEVFENRIVVRKRG